MTRQTPASAPTAPAEPGEGRLVREERFVRKCDTYGAFAPGLAAGLFGRSLQALPFASTWGALGAVALLATALSGQSSLGPRLGRLVLVWFSLVCGLFLRDLGGAPVAAGILVIGTVTLLAEARSLEQVRHREDGVSTPWWILAALLVPVVFAWATPFLGVPAGVLAVAAAGLAYLSLSARFRLHPEDAVGARLAILELVVGWALCGGVWGLLDARHRLAVAATGQVLGVLGFLLSRYLEFLAVWPGVGTSLGLTVVLVPLWFLFQPRPLEATPGRGLRWQLDGPPDPAPPLAGPEEIRILPSRSGRARPAVTRAGGSTECPYCAVPMDASRAVACTRCQTWHHDDCWQESGRCTTYGCGGAAAEPAG